MVISERIHNYQKIHLRLCIGWCFYPERFALHSCAHGFSGNWTHDLVLLEPISVWVTEMQSYKLNIVKIDNFVFIVLYRSAYRMGVVVTKLLGANLTWFPVIVVGQRQTVWCVWCVCVFVCGCCVWCVVCVCFVRSQTVKGRTQKTAGVWTSPSKTREMCHSCFCCATKHLKQQFYMQSKLCTLRCIIVSCIECHQRRNHCYLQRNKVLPSVRFTQKDYLI